MNKKLQRLRRSLRGRSNIRRLGAVRLVVHRTACHIYAQVINSTGDKVLATASTLEKTLRSQSPNGGNVAAAKVVGKLIAERALEAGVKKIAFDRSGFKYHGRIRALADAAREAGLDF
ncbi:MAG: 50S ribosomal protein L18 [Gammaproteobacteria bacterium]